MTTGCFNDRSQSSTATGLLSRTNESPLAAMKIGGYCCTAIRECLCFVAFQEQRKKMIEASLLMDNAKHLRQVFGGTLVTSVLAVYLASGGDFSAFFVFFPQFLSAIWYTSAVACLVCYGNRRARQQREEMAEEEGFNTGAHIYFFVSAKAVSCGTHPLAFPARLCDKESAIKVVGVFVYLYPSRFQTCFRPYS